MAGGGSCYIVRDCHLEHIQILSYSEMLNSAKRVAIEAVCLFKLLFGFVLFIN